MEMLLQPSMNQEEELRLNMIMKKGCKDNIK